MSRKSKNPAQTAAALHQQAMQEEEKGDYAAAQELYEKSLKIKRELGDRAGIAYTLGQLGNVQCSLQNYHQAQTLYEECLKISQEIKDKSSTAKALHQLAILQQEQKNYGPAQELYEESLHIEKELKDKAGIAESLAQMGRLAEIQGNLAQAAGFYAVALSLFNQLNSPYGKLVARWFLQVKEGLIEDDFQAAVTARTEEYKEYL